MKLKIHEYLKTKHENAMTKNRFLNMSIGVSMIMLSAAFLLRSISPAQAAPSPENFIAEETNKIGKYMITMTPTTADSYTMAMVWDTETGKSILYYYSNGKFQKSPGNLPENPLGE